MPRPSRTVADAVAQHALSLPEVWEDHPWEGDRVAKVRKKIFAFLAGDDTGSLGLKLPHSGGFALSLACARPMPYGLGKHGWVTLQLGDASIPDVDLLREWVEESYRAVAPTTLARQLDG
jgi:predicted DNA-binding protein (MmcQ/YjbR family)